ncbi:DMT family transporter [Rhizobium sp. C1]|uniref:DMT family transporter n=1 Tax=Rhizobium sp. C1 TaxID=1349799 RepID=UPI001E31C4B4|nr:DMT family transporter [Rhizobium sp. C1]MCD2177622.1 DMT family transporter [Rhizobium sp. C1]
MYLGILAGLTTCALWGLTFVAPRAVMPFSAFDLAAARYGVFGLTCILLMLNPRFRPRGAPLRLWMAGIVLGSVGYAGYFLLVSFAVNDAGAVIPPLITGLMPVLLPVIANVRENALPWRALALPLGLIVVGLIVANVSTLSHLDVAGSSSLIRGALWATAALVVWISYGIGNATIMRRADAPDALHWTGMQGVGSALSSLLLLPTVSYGLFATATTGEIVNFATWSISMGLAASWLATWCWVYAAKHLPLSLTSQLIIAETVFGVAFGLIYEGRLPTVPEGLGAALQVLGVAMAVYVFGRERRVELAVP